MCQRKKPERKCLGCGEKIEKRNMLRVVKSPAGEISFDLTGKKSGRGAYICKNVECFAKARNKKGFERSFKSAIPEDIYDTLQDLLKELKQNE
ncbi:MAG: YlxR family protein [Eubacterium sp.]|jgi:predicted RNA-binding protein YlxR (DUF448 family)|nr:YlxR family protein [Eubacterium sp.]